LNWAQVQTYKICYGKFNFVHVCRDKNNTDPSYGSFKFEDICSLNTFRDNFSIRVNASKDDGNEINLLKEKIARLENNQTNLKNIQTNRIEKSLPNNFEDAFWLFDIQYGKLLTNENHIKIFQTHQNQKTCTPALLWSNFPTPFLPFDSDYIDEYNEAILDFQLKALNLGIKYCKIRAETNVKTINAYKEKYINTDKIDEKIDNIKAKKEKNLKSKFDSENERVLGFKRQLIRVLDKENKNDNYLNQTQYRRGSHSTPNSQNKSRTFSENRNKRHDRSRSASNNRNNNRRTNNNNRNNNKNRRSNNYNNNRNNNTRNNNNQSQNFQESSSFNENG
jgi:hypothetical protein